MSYIRIVGDKKMVWSGLAKRTKSGLTKKDLTKSKTGKIVSKKKQAAGRKLAKKFPDMLFRKQN